MPQPELLKLVVTKLAQLQIPYMVTGSVASSFYGEARSTHDVDLVVLLTNPDVSKLVGVFPPARFYVSESAVREALTQGVMFNVIELETGFKIDFWPLADSPFDQTAFRRRRMESIEGIEIYFAAPDDLILAKLRWAKLSGGSEKQLTDAVRIYEVQAATLDDDYLEVWARQLDVTNLWHEVLRLAKPIGGEN